MAKSRVTDKKGNWWVYDDVKKQFTSMEVFNSGNNGEGFDLPINRLRTKEEIEKTTDMSNAAHDITDVNTNVGRLFNQEGMDWAAAKPTVDTITEPREEPEQLTKTDEEEPEEEIENDSEDGNDEGSDQGGNSEDESEGSGENGEAVPEEARPEGAAKGLGDGAKAAEGAEAEAGAAAEGAAATEAAATAAAETATVAAAEGAAVVTAEAGAVTVGMAGWIVIIIVAVLIVLAILVALLNGKSGDKAGASELGTPSVICIDPGHPSDIAEGTSSPDGTQEKVMNQLVGDDLNAALTTMGYKVVMTKTAADNNKKISNTTRADICAAAGAAMMYRIHMDSPTSSSNPADSGVPGPWHEVPGPSFTNIHDTSLKYGQAIQKSLAAELGVTGKKSGPQPIDGGVVNDTKLLQGSVEANAKNLPAVLLEMMTMDNVNVAWLKNSTNRAKFVKGIAAGIKSVIPPVVSGGGGTSSLLTKACDYVKSVKAAGCVNRATCPGEKLYNGDKLKEFSDCYGFSSTALKFSGADPQVDPNGYASDAIKNYFGKHPEKYEIIRAYSTKDLKPGDIMFNVGSNDWQNPNHSSGSHSHIFTGGGTNSCGCSGNALSASYTSHGPQCSNWYDAMKFAVRLK